MVHEDWDRLVETIYDAALEPERWDDWLRRYSGLNRGAGMYLGQSNLSEFGLGDIWTFRMERGGWRAVETSAQVVGKGETVTAVAAMPLYRTFTRTDVIPDERMENDPLMSAFLDANGYWHVKASKVQADSAVATVFFMALPKQHPFSHEETERFGLLARHLGRAMRIHRRLTQKSEPAVGLRRMLDQLVFGVILVDRNLQVVYANASAEAALEKGQGLRRRGRYLSCRSRSVLEKLTKTVRSIADGAFEADVAVPRSLHEPPLGLHLMPLRGEATSRLAPRAEVAIFLLDPGAMPPEPSVAMLRLVHDLTDTEARVAVLSARALRPIEIAEALGVSENTIKTHLRSIFHKVGCRTQAELVRLVLCLIPPA